MESQTKVTRTKVVKDPHIEVLLLSAADVKTPLVEPRVELKAIKTFRGMEGHGFNADVYIDGIRCFFVMDAGNGGCYDYEYYFHDKTADQRKAIELKINELNLYIESLPPVKSEYFEGQEFKQDLDGYLNEIFIKYLEAKDLKNFENKLKKLYVHALVIGVPDSGKYSFIDFKQPLKDVPKARLQQHYTILKSKCKDGRVFWNPNLVGLGIAL